MPALGADMESGQVVQWLVKPGDRVRPGDVVAVVETHKGAIDVECFLDGVIEDLAPIGQSLPVGAMLAQVHDAPGARGASPEAGVAQPAPAARQAPSAADTPPRPQAVLVAAPLAPSGAPAALGRVRASPAARRLAREQGVDITMLAAHGAGGAVVRADVEQAMGLQAPVAQEAAEPRTARLRPGGFDPVQMRQAIALAMTRSKREIPHYYLEETFDLGPALQWVEAFNRDRPPAERVLLAALLLKAVAVALRQVPGFNGFCVDGSFQPARDVHVGWAIALRGGGLVAPAIHHADRMDLPALMAALRDLVQRARAGGLRSSELTDPTITVTSLGDRGAERVQGVIYPPQVAIVGFGRVRQGPWVQDDAISVRPLVHCSLAADHRTSDGHLGSQFLAAIAKALLLPGQP
jgi:pyruvate dehydrogenase E2 component (dihydrolipoamide acetyltransferase)